MSALPSWDLSDFYQSPQDPAIAQDLEACQQKTDAFTNTYKKQIKGLSGADFATAIKAYEEIEEIIGKVSSYAYLLFAENMEHEAHATFYQTIEEKTNQISKNLLFFELEINELEEGDLKNLLESPEMSHFRQWVEDVRIFKPYQLQEDLETLLHEKYVSGRMAWVRLFDETLAGMRFEVEGKKIACSDALNLLSDKQESVRKSAALALSKGFNENIKLFTHVTNTLAKDKEIEDTWRGYKSPLQSRNLANLLEDEVVESLVSSVKNNYANLSHRYYRLKASWMGKKKLSFWDRVAPLEGAETDPISWEKAKEIVLNSYHAFSPDLAEIGKEFFEKNWIDAALREGKDSGAFSHPTVPSVHPYILMNYHGKTRDVMTLAHELGHGIHQVLSKEQGHLLADTPLTLAETASVFGEMLTFQHLVSTAKDKEARKLIIADKVEDMLATVVRQIAFHDFETHVHQERKQGEVSSERLAEIWMTVQRESLGDAFDLSAEYKNYWVYVSHFIHVPFYVYAYAFGDCLVNSLYMTYQEQPEGFVDKYIELLRAGGTKRHYELLAPFGLDAREKTFWDKGLKLIENYINELENG